MIWRDAGCRRTWDRPSCCIIGIFVVGFWSSARGTVADMDSSGSPVLDSSLEVRIPLIT